MNWFSTTKSYGTRVHIGSTANTFEHVTARTSGTLFSMTMLFCLTVMGLAFSLSADELNGQETAASRILGTLSSSIAALALGNTVSDDAVLTGRTLTTKFGQTEEGTVRLVSSVSGMTRVEINSSSDTRTETRRVSGSSQAGESSNTSGRVSAAPLHNLLVDPAWFFPEHIVSREIGSARVAVFIPATQMDGTTAVGVDSYLTSTLPSHNAAMRQMSELKVFFDQKTLLPIETQFNSHGDNSLLAIIPTRVVYSNYQSVQGHLVPFHIQRYEKDVLRDDITITSAVLNSGISPSQYSLN